MEIWGFSFVRNGVPSRPRTASAVSASETPASERGLHGVAPGVGMASGLYDVGLGAGVDEPAAGGAGDADDVAISATASSAVSNVRPTSV